MQECEELPNFAWVKFEQFDALYAKLAIIPNGLIGSAVFNGDYMFSQIGVEYKNGNAYPSNNTAYQYFTTDVAETVFNNGLVINGFVPNILFDLKEGKGWFGAGKTIINKNGVIETDMLSQTYHYCSGLNVSIDTLLTMVHPNTLSNPPVGNTPIVKYTLELTDDVITKAGVRYFGETYIMSSVYTKT